MFPVSGKQDVFVEVDESEFAETGVVPDYEKDDVEGGDVESEKDGDEKIWKHDQRAVTSISPVRV